ncbi:hypothetical protein AJ88_46355 [Mesorhizobium amorphae CCBAU 01583]|nr:hypothetical protein AJ88_46355 [Mesorhizobium amorphae CCBAU 01583]
MLTQTDPSDFAPSDTLGGRISFAREVTKLTMAQAARQLGVQTACWKAWECDRAAPQSNRLAMMAGILAVSPSWLLSGIGAGPLELEANDRAALLQELQIASAEAVVSQKRVQQIVALLGSVPVAGDSPKRGMQAVGS